MPRFRPPLRVPDYKSKEQICKELPDAIQFVVNSQEGCAWFDLQQSFDPDNNYAIVVGWSECDDPDYQNDEYYHNGYRVSIKIGANPVKSLMQCDFDWDWPQLVVDNNGEVWNTGMWLFPDEDLASTLDWLFEQWDAMKEFMDNKEKTRQ